MARLSTSSPAGSGIEFRTLSVASRATRTFAHGLPAVPDYCFAYVNQTDLVTIATNQSQSISMIPILSGVFDATNVTVQNAGNVDCTSAGVVVVLAHSIQR